MVIDYQDDNVSKHRRKALACPAWPASDLPKLLPTSLPTIPPSLPIVAPCLPTNLPIIPPCLPISLPIIPPIMPLCLPIPLYLPTSLPIMCQHLLILPHLPIIPPLTKMQLKAAQPSIVPPHAGATPLPTHLLTLPNPTLLSCPNMGPSVPVQVNEEAGEGLRHLPESRRSKRNPTAEHSPLPPLPALPIIDAEKGRRTKQGEKISFNMLSCHMLRCNMISLLPPGRAST